MWSKTFNNSGIQYTHNQMLDLLSQRWLILKSESGFGQEMHKQSSILCFAISLGVRGGRGDWGRENRGGCVYTGRTSSSQIPVERVSSHLMQWDLHRDRQVLLDFDIVHNQHRLFPSMPQQASVAGKDLFNRRKRCAEKGSYGWQGKAAPFCFCDLLGYFPVLMWSSCRRVRFFTVASVFQHWWITWHTKDLPAANVTTLFTIIRVEHRFQIFCIHLF